MNYNLKSKINILHILAIFFFLFIINDANAQEQQQQQQQEEEKFKLVCDVHNCINGECSIKNNKPYCACRQDWVGSKCDMKDPCRREAHPCNSNGACFPIIQTRIVPGQSQLQEYTDYHCQCFSGFWGKNCENVPDKPCTSFPCLNNGLCINKNNSYDYTCICLGGYTGANCGTYIDPCAGRKCQNDGLCIPGKDHNYTCSCKSGFTGQFCEIEINECSPNPCQNNGTCYDLVDAFFCECKSPYFGQLCQDYKNPCDQLSCPSGSVCVAVGSSAICQCQSGFFGVNCDKNPCENSPCGGGNNQCIPIDTSIINGISGCSCNTESPKYICVCRDKGQNFGTLSC